MMTSSSRVFSFLLFFYVNIIPLVQGQTCPSFVAIDATGIGTDFTKLILEPNCPTGTQKLPRQVHYHISTTSVVGTTVGDEGRGLVLTGSEAGIVKPNLTPRGLELDFNDSWDGNGAVGVEIMITDDEDDNGTGRLFSELELYGVRDHVFVTDTVGGLSEVRDDGVDNVLTITSDRSGGGGTVRYAHNGSGGTVTINAPNAVLDIAVGGVDHTVNILSCRSVGGVITGTDNRVFLAMGEVTSLQVTGTNNGISSIETGACANVVLQEGLGNTCTDAVANEIPAVTILDCFGPFDDTVQCSSSAVSSWTGGSTRCWFIAAVFTAGLGFWGMLDHFS